MIRAFSAVIFLSLTFISAGQNNIQRQKLPYDLREISGLEAYNDTILVAINDGGNPPELFFLDLRGRIVKRTLVFNATNTDWEDLAKDDNGFLYIADAGNNLCNRSELICWKIDLQNAFINDSVSAELIRFSFADKNNTNSEMKGCRFDSEGLYWYNDSLNILTKNTTRPRKNYWDNGSSVYRIPDIPGNYNSLPSNHLWTGGDNRIENQVTGADAINQKLAVLTYGKVFFYTINGAGLELTENCMAFPSIKQREAIVFMHERFIIIGAERHPLLGGPYLYTVTWN